MMGPAILLALIVMLWLASQREDFVCNPVAKTIPVRLGSLTESPAVPDDARTAMQSAVDDLNRRCKLDYVLLAWDGTVKRIDVQGNVQYSAQAHVFSRKLNISVTYNVTTVQPSGQTIVYTTSMDPLSTPADQDTSSVQPAPEDVFGRTFAGSHSGQDYADADFVY